MVNLIPKTIALVNMGHFHKKSKIKSKFINEKLLEKFQQLNIIKGYAYVDGFFEIYFSVSNHTRIKVHSFYRTNSKLYITKNQIFLKKLCLFSTIYLLSTPYGILTQYEAKNKNCGGYLVSKITLY
jgi:ribosomal protein S8